MNQFLRVRADGNRGLSQVHVAVEVKWTLCGRQRTSTWIAHEGGLTNKNETLADPDLCKSCRRRVEREQQEA